MRPDGVLDELQVHQMCEGTPFVTTYFLNIESHCCLEIGAPDIEQHLQELRRAYLRESKQLDHLAPKQR